MSRAPSIALALLLLGACAGPQIRPESVVPPLPEQVPLKSTSEAITPDYLFVLRAGRLWFRPNPDSGVKGGWELVGDGLPQKWWWMSRTDAIAEISADGTYLVARGEDGLFYSLRWGTGWVSGWGTLVSLGKGEFVWSRDWDFPLKPFTAPLTLNMPGLRQFSFSSRTKFNVGNYTDGNGYKHWLDFGCDTFFALSGDGTLIHFADPWLSDGFSRKITTPAHGRVRGLSLSAAASTLLLMDTAGRLHTRMFDFDISGEDFYFFRYTYADADSAFLRVRLPLADWVEQPVIPGKTTARVTIVAVAGQQGNDARELRVEGVDGGGHPGYYAKGIAAAAWTFVPTDAPLSAALLEPATPLTTPGDAGLYDVEAKGKLGEADVALTEFNTVSWQPARLTVAGTALTLSTHELLVDSDHQAASLKGAILLPDPAALAALPPAFAAAFGQKPFVEVRLHLDAGRVVITPESGAAFELRLDTTAPIHLD